MLDVKTVRMVCLIFLFTGGSSAQAAGGYAEWVEQAAPTPKQLARSAELLREKKSKETNNRFMPSPFHKRDVNHESLRPSICQSCHTSLPHARSVRLRTYLNMHTPYVSCEVCHLNGKARSLEYAWRDFSDVDMPLLAVSQTQTPKAEDKGGIVPATGVRIDVFQDSTPVSQRKDSLYSRQVAERWKASSEKEKVALHAALHAPLNDKGWACTACHADRNTKLELSDLSLDEEKVTKLKGHPLVNFFSRYRKTDDRLSIVRMLKSRD